MAEDEKDPNRFPVVAASSAPADATSDSSTEESHTRSTTQSKRAGDSHRGRAVDIGEIMGRSLASVVPDHLGRMFSEFEKDLRRASPFDQIIRLQLLNREGPLEQSLAAIQGLVRPASGIEDALRNLHLGVSAEVQHMISASLDQLKVAPSVVEALGKLASPAQDQLHAATIGKPFEAFSAFQQALVGSPAFMLYERLGRNWAAVDEASGFSASPVLQQILRNANLSKVFAAVGKVDAARVFEQSAALSDLASYASASFRMAPDGSVILDGETAGLEEVQRAVDDLLAEPERFLSDLRSTLERFAKPVQAVLLYLIDRVFWMLLAIAITPHIDRTTTLQLRQIQQEIRLDNAQTRREVTDTIRDLRGPRSARGEWRVATGDEVRVRTRPRKNASVVGSLRLGQVVRFLEKHQRWILIHFEEPETEMLEQGWVHGKYLRRIPGPAYARLDGWTDATR